MRSARIGGPVAAANVGAQRAKMALNFIRRSPPIQQMHEPIDPMNPPCKNIVRAATSRGTGMRRELDNQIISRAGKSPMSSNV